MARYKTIYTEVEVEVDISEFDDDDLVEELEDRNIGIMIQGDNQNLLNTIWLKRRTGQDYQPELDQLIYQTLGHVV
jgi:hypothetical protein